MKQEEKLPLLYRNDSRRAAELYSREEVVKERPQGTRVTIYGNKDHWTAFKDCYVLTCLGSKVFWKKTSGDNVTFKGGNIYGNLAPFRHILIEVFNYDWIKDNEWVSQLLLERKDLWKMIFSGKITNPEILCKTFSRKYFKGVFSYATLKEYARYRSSTPLWDLYYHTTNPEEALKRCCSCDYTYETLFMDCLHYAKILNTKINPMWSGKRLHAVHQQQIELTQKAKIDKVPCDEVFPAYEADGLSLINNERECYLEACKMHNCVHSCYWKRIARGSYLIARGMVGSSKDKQYVDVGIGVKTEGNNIVLRLDQVHTIYNGSVDNDTERLCYNWIEEHHDALVDRSYAAFKHYAETVNKACEEDRRMQMIENNEVAELAMPF